MGIPAPASPELATMIDAPEPLARNRDFRLVLIGQGISAFGDAITNTALPLLVLALTGSGFAMGVVGAISTLPDLLVGLAAGAWADRWDRRLMMFAADLGRAVLTALIPLAALLGGPTLLVIFLVAFPINVLRVLWLAGYTASVPGLVGRRQVARANATFEAVFNVGWIAGPAIAGILAAVIGPGPTIALDAGSFAISSGALLLVRRSLRPEARPNRPHLLADIREGIAYVVGHPTLRATIALWASTQVTTAALTSALIYHVTRDRHLTADVVGLILSAFGVGSLLGALVAGRLDVERVGRAMLAGNVLTGLTLLLIMVRPPVPVVIASAFGAGIISTNVLIAYITLRTALSPDALLGRIGSTARTISVGLIPIGAFVGGALIDLTDGGTTLGLMGAALVVVALAFAFVPSVRRARVPHRPARAPDAG